MTCPSWISGSNSNKIFCQVDSNFLEQHFSALFSFFQHIHITRMIRCIILFVFTVTIICRAQPICYGCWSSTTLTSNAARGDLSAVTTNNNLTVFAGGHSGYSSPVTTAWFFTKHDGVISDLAGSLSVGRKWLTCVSAGNFAIFAGAQSTLTIDIRDNDPHLPHWFTRNLISGNQNMASVYLPFQNQVLFVGGQQPSSAFDNRIQMLDLTTANGPTVSLSPLTLSAARAQLSCVVLSNNTVENVFCAGGYDNWSGYNQPPSFKDTVDIFTFNQNNPVQIQTAVLSVPRYSLVGGTVANPNTGEIFVLFAGGIMWGGMGSNEDVPSTAVDIYSDLTKSWSTGSLSVARRDITGTSLGGRFYVAGGRDNVNNYYSVVDVFTAKTKSWSILTLPNPNGARSLISATINQNLVLFIGGDLPPSSASSSGKIDILDTNLLLDPNDSSSSSSTAVGSGSFVGTGPSSSSSSSASNSGSSTSSHIVSSSTGSFPPSPNPPSPFVPSSSSSTGPYLSSAQSRQAIHHSSFIYLLCTLCVVLYSFYSLL